VLQAAARAAEQDARSAHAGRLAHVNERGNHPAGCTLNAWHWLHPAELIRIRIRMTARQQASAEAATRHVRVDHAARRLYQLKTALDPHGQQHAHGVMAARRIRQAQHRAHRALTRAGFADPAVAVAVLRQVQVLTMTTELARLDYHTPDAAQAAIASLIGSPPAAKPGSDTATRTPANRINGHPAGSVTDAGARDAQLVAAAIRIVAAAARDGGRLSQVSLAERLRREGYTVANSRLRWLSAVSGLQPRHAAGPDPQPPEGRCGTTRSGRARRPTPARRGQGETARRVAHPPPAGCPGGPDGRRLGPAPADSRTAAH
jgi:hypothetical protein